MIKTVFVEEFVQARKEGQFALYSVEGKKYWGYKTSEYFYFIRGMICFKTPLSK